MTGLPPGIDHRRYSVVGPEFLGNPGYKAIVVDLKGELAKYNGDRCDPVPYGNESWLIRLPEQSGDTQAPELVVPTRSLIAFADHGNAEDADLTPSKVSGFSINMNNRSSAIVALESLCCEIQSSIRRHGIKGHEEMHKRL